MKNRVQFKNSIIAVLVMVMMATILQPVTVSAASTTEKKVTTKFTKTKAKGFETINSMVSVEQYLVAFGKKSSGNVASYSTDGTIFKDLDIDKEIRKQYSDIKLTDITLGTHPYYIENRASTVVMGTGKSQGKTYHFVVSITKTMKSVTVTPLNPLIEKLDGELQSIELEQYLDYNYDTGEILINGSYMDSNSIKTPFYIYSKKESALAAYKTPSLSSDRVEFVGKYMVCYKWDLERDNSDQSGKAYFYYSSNGTKWSKSSTPDNQNGYGWYRSYLDWDYFCVRPQNNNKDTYTEYYTDNMKDYKSISKDYVIKDGGSNMRLNKRDDKYVAYEQSYGLKPRFILSERSTKAGSKWKILLDYSINDSENFDYDEYSYVDKGILFIKDGSKKLLINMSTGKQYSTSIDAGKLRTFYSSEATVYGSYDSQYLFSTKNGFMNNYLYKTPVKINGAKFWSSKKTGDRMYVYSEKDIYYVNTKSLKK